MSDNPTHDDAATSVAATGKSLLKQMEEDGVGNST